MRSVIEPVETLDLDRLDLWAGRHLDKLISLYTVTSVYTVTLGR